MNEKLPPQSPAPEPARCACGMVTACVRVVCLLAWVLGIGGVSLLSASLLGSWMDYAYQPYGGVVGLPAMLNYPVAQEKGYYTLAMLSALIGWGVVAWALRRFPRVRFAALPAALLGLMACWLTRRYFPSQATDYLWQILHTPVALLQLGGVAFAVGWLACRDWDQGLKQETASVLPEKHWYLQGLPVLFHSLLLMIVWWPGDRLGAVIAGSILGIVLSVVNRGRKNEQEAVLFSRLAWWLFALAPLASLPIRWAIFHELAISPLVSGTVISALALAMVWASVKGSGSVARSFSHWLPVWTILGLTLAACPAFHDYDVFHQGEFSYPPFALAQGLWPWRDIFYVHGFGVDTLAGWLAGTPTPQWHSGDALFFWLQTALLCAIGAWALLRAWGRVWWLWVWVTLLPGAFYAGGPTARFLPAWILVAMLLLVIQSSRRGWLIAAGAWAFAQLYYSLDMAIVVTGGLFGWALFEAMTLHKEQHARWRPFVLALMGFTALGLVSLIVFAACGMVGEMLSLHLDYVRVKAHYDKIPILFDNIILLISPLATLAGLGALGRIFLSRRRGEDARYHALESLIVVFTCMNALTYVRAFDRSDLGHIFYATTLAWPLIGCLFVWRCRNLKPLSGIFALRLGVAVCALASLPYLHPLLTSSDGKTVTPTDVPYFVSEALQLRRAPMMQLPDGADDLAAIEAVAQLQALIEPDETFYDFSNQPALHSWSQRLSPSRFFTAYYASSIRWQDEVIDALERERPEWTVWRGAVIYWFPDAQPTTVRQWKIAAYLLRHYEPALHLSAIVHDEQFPAERLPNDHLFLRRKANPGLAFSPEARDILESCRPQWDEDLTLKHLPRVWGEHEQGVPPLPIGPPTSFDVHLSESDGQIWETNITGKEILRACEVTFMIEQPHDGSLEFGWETPGANGVSRRHRINFEVRTDFKGPYRVKLDNLPVWVWNGEPTKLMLKAECWSPERGTYLVTTPDMQISFYLSSVD